MGHVGYEAVLSGAVCSLTFSQQAKLTCGLLNVLHNSLCACAVYSTCTVVCTVALVNVFFDCVLVCGLIDILYIISFYLSHTPSINTVCHLVS